MANKTGMPTLYLNNYPKISSRVCKSERLASYHIPIMNPGPNLGAAVFKVSWNSSVHSLTQGALKFKQRIDYLQLFPPPAGDKTNDPGLPPAREEKSAPGTIESIARQYEARNKRMIPEVPFRQQRPAIDRIFIHYKLRQGNVCPVQEEIT